MQYGMHFVLTAATEDAYSLARCGMIVFRQSPNFLFIEAR